MKKLLILASIILFPAVSMAASQAAISQRGTCHVFKNNATVPGGWKNVDSCDPYKKKVSGQRLDAVNKRRNSSANWAKRYKKEDSTVRKNTLRMGSGKLTRGGSDRDALGTVRKKATRATTYKGFGTSKSHLLKDKRRITKSKEEWQRRRSARSGIRSGSATKMERSGQLSSKFWSTESTRRTSRLKTYSNSNKIKQALSRRQYLSKKGRVEKKEYKYKGPTLRRTYRGERMEGDLNN